MLQIFGEDEIKCHKSCHRSNNRAYNDSNINSVIDPTLLWLLTGHYLKISKMIRTAANQVKRILVLNGFGNHIRLPGSVRSSQRRTLQNRVFGNLRFRGFHLNCLN